MKKRLSKKHIFVFSVVAILIISVCLLVFKKNEKLSSYKQGDIIEIGSYPQSEVKDEVLLSNLNSLNLKWISYDYYINEEGIPVKSDYMKYADMNYEGKKYRAVTFSRYRSKNSKSDSTAINSNQYENGYLINEIYWFRYEPIKWTVLDAETGLLLCRSVIDSRAFSDTVYEGEKISPVKYAYYNDAELKHYASDYKASSLRKWLTSDFYKGFFSEKEREAIEKPVNSDDKINDYIFALSSEDVKNSKYGFLSNGAEFDETRISAATDYAKCMGVSCDFYDNATWLLRTSADTGRVCGIYEEGALLSNCDAGDTSMGIRPAMHIDLLETEKRRGN